MKDEMALMHTRTTGQTMNDERKKDNPAAEKAFSFALRIVKLQRHLSGFPFAEACAEHLGK